MSRASYNVLVCAFVYIASYVIYHSVRQLNHFALFSCVDTKSFIEVLFSALATQSYLTDQVAPDSTVADNTPLKQPTEPVVPRRVSSSSTSRQKSPALRVENSEGRERRTSSRSRHNSGAADGLRSRRSRSRSSPRAEVQKLNYS